MDNYGLPQHAVERVVCSIEAAERYEIPAYVMLAVAEKEGGKPGQQNKAAGNTVDQGSMQFNTIYLKDLAVHGITESDVNAAGCYPYHLAAWRIRQHLLRDKGDNWTRVANYHSKTPTFNASYRADLISKAKRWEQWLKAHNAHSSPNAKISARYQHRLEPHDRNNTFEGYVRRGLIPTEQ